MTAAPEIRAVATTSNVIVSDPCTVAQKLNCEKA